MQEIHMYCSFINFLDILPDKYKLLFSYSNSYCCVEERIYKLEKGLVKRYIDLDGSPRITVYNRVIIRLITKVY